MSRPLPSYFLSPPVDPLSMISDFFLTVSPVPGCSQKTLAIAFPLETKWGWVK